jgi:uncharacterized protein YydD (DUF2326 family)
MMLRLHRLSSEPKLFEPIELFTGINLILGEKWDDGQTQGRKVNGVGKSLSVEFLHFALLRDFTDTISSRQMRLAMPSPASRRCIS